MGKIFYTLLSNYSQEPLVCFGSNDPVWSECLEISQQDFSSPAWHPLDLLRCKSGARLCLRSLHIQKAFVRLCCESAFKEDKRGAGCMLGFCRAGRRLWFTEWADLESLCLMEPRSGRRRKIGQQNLAAKEDGVTSALTPQSFIQALLSSAVMSLSVVLLSRRSACSSCFCTAAAHWLYSDL